MLTRKSVEALRDRMQELGERLHEIAPVSYKNRVADCRAVVALCDHYLSAPAAEPTAGDARDIRAAAEEEADAFGPFSNDRTTAPIHRLAIVRAFEAFAIAQRQARPSLGEPILVALEPVLRRYRMMLANEECDCTMDGGVHTCGGPEANRELARLDELLARPSLGAAADGEERERCAQIVQDRIDLVERVERARAGKDPNGNASAARRLSLRNLRDCLFAIRASSPEGSPDGSPEGEGGRET